MALRPKGVAALPTPIMLAEMLRIIAPMAGESAGTSGKRRRMTGRSARAMEDNKPRLLQDAEEAEPERHWPDEFDGQADSIDGGVRPSPVDVRKPAGEGGDEDGPDDEDDEDAVEQGGLRPKPSRRAPAPSSFASSAVRRSHSPAHAKGGRRGTLR